MITIDIHHAGLIRVQRIIRNFPGNFKSIKRSALKRTGYWAKSELSEWIRGVPSQWRKMDPVTLQYKSKFFTGAGSAKRFRRRSKKTRENTKPLQFLARLSRYRVDKPGETLQIDFARWKPGQKPGPPDPDLKRIVTRIQSGRRIKVSPRMRRFFGGTRKKRPKRPQPGVDYIPLRKSTTLLDVPGRPIFDPFFVTIRSNVFRVFERFLTEKFYDYMNKGKTP